MQAPQVQQFVLAQATQVVQGQHVCAVHGEGDVQLVRAPAPTRKILQNPAWQGLSTEALQGLLYSPARPEPIRPQEQEAASVVGCAGECVMANYVFLVSLLHVHVYPRTDRLVCSNCYLSGHPHVQLVVVRCGNLGQLERGEGLKNSIKQSTGTQRVSPGTFMDYTLSNTRVLYKGEPPASVFCVQSYPHTVDLACKDKVVRQRPRSDLS